jgi:formylmethanofuran dehydrogenase subunit A
MQATQTYIRAADTEAVEFDQEWMILHPDQFTVTKVNEAGGMCWNLMSKPQTVQAMAEHLTEQYEITAEEAERDILQFLQRMQEIGMIRYGA